MTSRIGIGYDAHRFTEDRPLTLAGVTVDHPLGLQGHSDADVVTHALMDALLGASGLGDIGGLFPDTDARYAGVRSVALLEEVASRLALAGWRIVNADVTVVCEAPRLASYRDQMRAVLALAMGIDVGRVGVKGTTTEGMGFEGRGEGIAAMAVCLVERRQETA